MEIANDINIMLRTRQINRTICYACESICNIEDITDNESKCLCPEHKMVWEEAMEKLKRDEQNCELFLGKCE